MAGLTATYIDSDTFTVVGDLTSTFVVGRRVKANCGVDGYKFGTIESRSFGGGNTTVNLTANSDDLTSNLTEVWYGIVSEGTDGSVPIHTHDGAEGSGGEVTDADAIHDNVNGEINAIASKTTPANNDVIVIEDSAATYAKKKILASTLKVVNVNDEGTPVTGTPHSTLNFIGDQVVASNAGGGVANITITKRPIVQIVRSNITSVVTTNATISEAATPTNTSGVAFGSGLAITLNSASNIVRVQMVIPCCTDNDAGVPAAIMIRGTTVLAVATVSQKKDYGSQIKFDFLDTPGSVGPHTYTVRVGVENNNGYFNRTKNEANPFGGTLFRNNCWLSLTEIVV